VLIKDFFWMVMARSSNLFWIEFPYPLLLIARAMPNQRVALENR